VYASIRQGKAKPGMAEELTRRIKEGAIPIISDTYDLSNTRTLPLCQQGVMGVTRVKQKFWS
jgi:hypothetical protein